MKKLSKDQPYVLKYSCFQTPLLRVDHDHNLFSVSNEVPEHPCVSPVSNQVFERRLIEKYIAENGADPINGQPLSEEQLIDIKGGWLVCLFWHFLERQMRLRPGCNSLHVCCSVSSYPAQGSLGD